MNNFKFTDPENINKFYVYKNNYFFQRKKKKKILEYNQNLEGWSDNLTAVHEKSNGKFHPINIYSRENVIKFLELNNNKTILEIGCSSGWLIDNLKKKFKKINYVGVDVVKQPIEKLAKKYPNIPFLIFDITKNPLKKIKFDNIIMLNVLEHIRNDDLALKNSKELLKKNGKIFIEVPANQFLYDNYDKQLMHFRRYEMSNLLMKLEKNGYEVLKKNHLGFFCFFPFFFVKLFNKIFNKKNEVVKKQINLSNNFLLKLLIILEKKLSKIYFPIGIRCFVIAKKK
jgi:2-polyprenyl-3-methyl-5-hydroxy-6-metoxy-1,4-benzoquinol methylase